MYMCGMSLSYLKYHCGLAMIRRLLKIIGIFCKISSLYNFSFAKETYHFKEPTNRSHPIVHTCDTNPSCL